MNGLIVQRVNLTPLPRNEVVLQLIIAFSVHLSAVFRGVRSYCILNHEHDVHMRRSLHVTSSLRVSLYILESSYLLGLSVY